MPSIIPPIKAVPPFGMPLFRGTRPLKRWRYVALFNEEMMLCGAQIQLGPARQCFWALLEREHGRLRAKTRILTRRGSLELSAGRMLLSDGGVLLDITLEEEDGIQALCPHGRQMVWTRKQAGIAAHGRLSIDGGPARKIEALAVIDDTAGHHARETEWRWAAGVGSAPDGTPLAFNLVAGVNDPPSGSERAVWVAGVPREVCAVSFTEDLSEVSAQDGSRLYFSAEAQRSRKERLLVIKSDYTAPFGTFTGELPGGVELASGLGVMEHHRARW